MMMMVITMSMPGRAACCVHELCRFVTRVQCGWHVRSTHLALALSKSNVRASHDVCKLFFRPPRRFEQCHQRTSVVLSPWGGRACIVRSAQGFLIVGWTQKYFGLTKIFLRALRAVYDHKKTCDKRRCTLRFWQNSPFFCT